MPTLIGSGSQKYYTEILWLKICGNWLAPFSKAGHKKVPPSLTNRKWNCSQSFSLSKDTVYKADLPPQKESDVEDRAV